MTARNDRYTAKKVYIITCETCNEDITRPLSGDDVTTRADADAVIAEHERTWHDNEDLEVTEATDALTPPGSAIGAHDEFMRKAADLRTSRGDARTSAQSREQAAKPRRVKWQVWDVDRAKNRALVVDEGTEDHCAETAEYRNRLAKKHGMDALYMALPKGQTP